MRCAGATLAMFERGIWDAELVRTVCERTHVAPECVAACALFSRLLWDGLHRHVGGVTITNTDVRTAFEAGRAAIRDISACGLNKFGRETHILTTVTLIGYCIGLCEWAGSRGKKLDFTRTIDTVEHAGGDVDTNCAIAGLLLASRYDVGELARTAKFQSRKWLEEHI
jgi:ADP-ribosylglycohydrolase